MRGALGKDKRVSVELYDLKSDRDCVNNLAADSKHARLKLELQEQMIAELQAQQDPRMFGQGDIFEQYPYSDAALRGFYERYMKGEKLQAGWVNPTDFEPGPLDEKERLP